MASTTNLPEAVRRLDTPAAQALTDLSSIFEELQTVLRCCERLVSELATSSGTADDLITEAVWTTAVLSYARCFATGRRGMGLTEQDVAATELAGEVVEWHKVLRRLRKHYADPEENPRERFSVGAAQDSHGRVGGIAVTSTHQPPLDDVTVRQTGALAYQLSRMVERRIAEQQERVRASASALTKVQLDALPLIDIVEP
ncbi:MAG: hypothetical protein ACRDRN_15980 [Sciscionella sp.]